jgi:hypothetical protein
LHLNKKGNCNSADFLKEMDDYIKNNGIKDGQVFNCSLNWCALFVAYNLLKSYETAGLNTDTVKKTLTGYNWSVRFFVRVLLKNKIGEQSLIPRVGALFFSGSYVNNNYDHTGIVVCVDDANEKFYTVEGNVLDAENISSVQFVEYDFSEIASEKINIDTTDFTTSNTANFGKKIRFIHLLEKGGQWSHCGQLAAFCGWEDAETTVANVSTVPNCIKKTDCIENNKNYRYAVFTSDGWYVWSGKNGFGKYKPDMWLKLQDPAKCDFAEIKCNKENCNCEGCDCKTLQDKLDVLKNDLQLVEKCYIAFSLLTT